MARAHSCGPCWPSAAQQTEHSSPPSAHSDGPIVSPIGRRGTEGSRNGTATTRRQKRWQRHCRARHTGSPPPATIACARVCAASSRPFGSRCRSIAPSRTGTAPDRSTAHLSSRSAGTAPPAACSQSTCTRASGRSACSRRCTPRLCSTGTAPACPGSTGGGGRQGSSRRDTPRAGRPSASGTTKPCDPRRPRQPTGTRRRPPAAAPARRRRAQCRADQRLAAGCKQPALKTGLRARLRDVPAD